MRRKIYSLIDPSGNISAAGKVYSLCMAATILISLIPLSFKETNAVFRWIDIFATAVFIIDYLLRIITADIKMGKGALSFALYPFTPMAIVDLLAILPAFLTAVPGLRMLKIFRLLRTFRVFRAFKIFRYSKNITIIVNVIHKQKTALLTVATLAIGYVLISALVIFNVEPDTFGDFFDAIYWATVSLTTVGYGDLYPVTVTGRIVAMVSSFIGIAIVALPAGIITAGYMDEIQKKDDNYKD